MLRPSALGRGDILAIDRAYIDYEKFEQLTERGVIYLTKLKKSLRYTVLSDTMYQTSDGFMEGITLMYYVDFHSLFNNPEKDWETILTKQSGAPPLPSLFD